MKRLLVVDDNPADVGLLRAVLAEARSEVVVDHAQDGLEALERLSVENEAGVPDLILLDLNMPRLGGFEVLEILSKHARWSGIPVMVWSSSARSEDIERSYSLGALSYVVKGSDLDAVYRSAATVGLGLSTPLSEHVLPDRPASSVKSSQPDA